MRQVCLDTETTGSSVKAGNRIIEVGCVEVVDLKKTGNTFPKDGKQFLLDPERGIEEGAIRVHGITPQMVKGRPKFKDIVDEFLEFIDGAELIIHNAPFDLGFLNHELALIGKSSLQNPVLDTLSVARKKFPGQSASLDSLCKRFAIDNSSRTFHGALLDSELLADVFIRMFENDGVTSNFADWGKVKKSTAVRPKVDFPIREFPISEDETTLHNQYLAELGIV